MADFNMDNYNEIKVNENKVDPGLFNGKVHTLSDEYTFGAEAAVNDEYLLNLLPEGAIIKDAVVKAPSLGATGIFDLGLKAYSNKAESSVAEDQDSLVQQADFGGAAALAKMGAGAVGFGKIIGKGGAQPFLKCTELTAAATGLKIEVKIDYVLPY